VPTAGASAAPTDPLIARITQINQQRDEAISYLKDGLDNNSSSQFLAGLGFVKAAADTALTVYGATVPGGDVLEKLYDKVDEIHDAGGPDPSVSVGERLLKAAGALTETFEKDIERSLGKFGRLITAGPEFGEAAHDMWEAIEKYQEAGEEGDTKKKEEDRYEGQQKVESALAHLITALAATAGLENAKERAELVAKMMAIREEINQAFERLGEAKDQKEIIEKQREAINRLYDRMVERAKARAKLLEFDTSKLPPVPPARAFIPSLEKLTSGPSRTRKKAHTPKWLATATKGSRPLPSLAPVSDRAAVLTPPAPAQRRAIHASPYAAVQGKSGRYVLIPKEIVPDGIANGTWTPDQVLEPKNVPAAGWQPTSARPPIAQPTGAPVPDGGTLAGTAVPPAAPDEEVDPFNPSIPSGSPQTAFAPVAKPPPPRTAEPAVTGTSGIPPAVTAARAPDSFRPASAPPPAAPESPLIPRGTWPPSAPTTVLGPMPGGPGPSVPTDVDPSAPLISFPSTGGPPDDGVPDPDVDGTDPDDEQFLDTAPPSPPIEDPDATIEVPDPEDAGLPAAPAPPRYIISPSDGSAPYIGTQPDLSPGDSPDNYIKYDYPTGVATDAPAAEVPAEIEDEQALATSPALLPETAAPTQAATEALGRLGEAGDSLDPFRESSDTPSEVEAPVDTAPEMETEVDDTETDPTRGDAASLGGGAASL